MLSQREWTQTMWLSTVKAPIPMMMKRLIGWHPMHWLLVGHLGRGGSLFLLKCPHLVIVLVIGGGTRRRTSGSWVHQAEPVTAVAAPRTFGFGEWRHRTDAEYSTPKPATMGWSR
jgi:hypothetical protein